jgi:hypothetical protein
MPYNLCITTLGGVGGQQPGHRPWLICIGNGHDLANAAGVINHHGLRQGRHVFRVMVTPFKAGPVTPAEARAGIGALLTEGALGKGARLAFQAKGPMPQVRQIAPGREPARQQPGQQQVEAGGFKV